MSEYYIYGLHAVTALIKNPLRKIKKLLISEDRHDQRMQDLIALANAKSLPFDRLSAHKMNQQFKDHVHQGIVAVVEPLREYTEHDLSLLLAQKDQTFILILDGITDPQNLGACLRTADAAGVDFVIIPKDKSAGLSPVVSKVACGAAESIPLIKVTNLIRAMEILKQQGIWIYGAAGEAQESLYQLQIKGSIAVVLGAEGKGLRRLTREHCDFLFSIPMVGTVESLNVSVATGIALYEILRQQL